MLEWVAIAFSVIFPAAAAVAAAAKSLQSCLTLCNPKDGNPSGSPVHGILQARILEWVAISFSRGSSQPRSSTFQADTLLSEPPGLLCHLKMIQGKIHFALQFR